MTAMIFLTECNNSTTTKFPFEVNTTIERKVTRNASDNTGKILSQNIPRQMSLLEYVVILLSSVLKTAIFGLCHYCVQ